jgi:response regulator RpfG family c-di-GMP phosphodiesterase
METLAKRSLLLVDDEPDSLEPIGILLEQEYHVLTAASGPEALDLLEESAVDVIIADQRMPGMTGVELLAKVRERYPEIVRLILTAYTDFDAMLKAINEGRVYRYIIKPWDPEDMMLIVRQAFDWKDLREAQGHLATQLAEANVLVRHNNELVETRASLLAQKKLARMGVTLCQQVAELHGGTITQTEALDGVTTITVQFPVE